MVSAWAKKVEDPAPLCEKSAKIMRSVTTYRRSEIGGVLCKPRTVPFQSKAVLHRFVFVRAMLGKNACRPTTWLPLLRLSRKDEPASDWPGQRIDETLPGLTVEWVEKRALSLSLESKFTNEGWV